LILAFFFVVVVLPAAVHQVLTTVMTPIVASKSKANRQGNIRILAKEVKLHHSNEG
jgi:hypothetical protein